MPSTKWLNAFAVGLAAVAVGLVALKNYRGNEQGQILNVSYDATREVYKEINSRFVPEYESETGRRVRVEQSHGGSSRQARAVAEGLPADVVTLAIPSDIDGLSRHGLIASDWKERFPHNSQPYASTIIFVVWKTNPKHIKDWPDLIGRDITIVTPGPNTSGNGKLSFLAAWGSIIYRGGSEDEAREFLTKIYHHVPILNQSARDSSTTFALAKEGDVHLTWENEALREVAESKGELEVVYPPVSILAEPSVTWVDENVKKHHSGSAAKAYLAYLFSDAAQEIFAQNVFGSSSHLINGPTNAISLVVFSALTGFDARFDAYQAMFLLGIMVGVTQILISVFKLGDLTRYISESVVLGFMAGAGLLVGIGQVGNFLGVSKTGSSHCVLVNLWGTITHSGPYNLVAIALGLGTLLTALALRQVINRYKLPRMDTIRGAYRH